MRIPEAKIDEIRNSVNILDVISNHVSLKKRGKNFIGLCPFHSEKTPSFTVSEDKQIFHCFGCHKGGDVFKFLMTYKNISYVEAVQEVAEQVGIKISLSNDSISEEQTIQELYYDINVFAARYFSNNLLLADDGEVARQYFKKRNIKQNTIKAFGLGYAKPDWQDLYLLLKENGFDIDKSAELGLIDKKADGGFYDKFRDRVIFPIFSANGRVIGFGGRVFEKKPNTAKYLNSPESIIYSKRKSLYGLYHSKDEIRRLDKAILVEGYMDLLSLFQSGVKNVVASSGTSLTEEQVTLLSRFTHNIIVLFDADAAGQNASMRSIEILLKQNFSVKVVSLPEGEDPDSFINKFGKDDFNEQINSAKNFLDFQAEQFERAGMLSDPDKAAVAIRELVKTIALIDDELKRNIFIKSISKKFGFREMLLESELEKHKNLLVEKEIRQNSGKLMESFNFPSSQEIKKISNDKVTSFEREIITLMFEGNKDVLGIIFDHIMPDDFANENVRFIAENVYQNFRKGIYSAASLIEKINNEQLKDYIIRLSLNQESISKHWQSMNNGEKIELDYVKYAEDLVRNYQIIKIDLQIEELTRDIAASNDESSMINKMKFINELQIEKKKLGDRNGQPKNQ